MTIRQDVSTATLISDLISEVRTLIRQELALARAEVREQFRNLLMALTLFAMAALTLVIAGVWMLVAVTRAVADLFDWPLWGVFAVIGLALGAAGLVLLAVGWHQVRQMSILPKTRETMKEHVPWSASRVEVRE